MYTNFLYLQQLQWGMSVYVTKIGKSENLQNLIIISNDNFAPAKGNITATPALSLSDVRTRAD